MKRFAIFVAVSLAILVVVGWLFGLAFSSPADRRAVEISAGVSFVVQLFTFAVMLLVRGGNLFAAWGIGVLVRFVVVVAYAFLVLRGMGLPPESALLSLVTFFFLSTLVEPVLLRP